MAKLIILSIVLISFALPIRLAASPHPRRTLRRMQTIVFVYIFVWAYMCVRWYPQLVPLK